MENGKEKMFIKNYAYNSRGVSPYTLGVCLIKNMYIEYIYNIS